MAATQKTETAPIDIEKGDVENGSSPQKRSEEREESHNVKEVSSFAHAIGRPII